MSLESYKSSVEAQRKRDEGYSQPQPQVTETEYVYIEQPKCHKRGGGWLIFGGIIIALLCLAALKNPSKTEAKAEIKTMIMEKVTEKMRQEVAKEDNDAWTQIGSGLAMLFAPTIIDSMVQTDISDYIFFSTFDASVTVDEEKRTLAAGIILFGKVIPLRSDIKKESPSMTE